ncbi:conserved hypothetical protein, partial [Trichinella spiralis]
KSYFSQNV